MKLFDFQLHANSVTRRSFARKNKRVILNAPTGFGKTVLCSYMAKSALDKGQRVLILVHRIEILWQFFATLQKFGLTPNLITASTKSLHAGQFYLGMVETVRARVKKGIMEKIDPSLIICDEVHWGSYESIVDHFHGFVLGLTATPKASSGQELNQYFDDCVCPVSVSELISMGRLVKGRTFSIEHDFSHIRMSGKDFNAKLLHEEFKKPKLFTGVLEQYEKHAKGLKAIVYSVNIEHSKEVAKMFGEAGYPVFYVDAKSDLRFELMDGFKNSENGILFNVGIATTGFDEPSVRCIIENYATAQITKHVQVVGRGARCMEGKDEFRIIDMGRNYMRHGLYGEDIDWIAIFNNPKLGKSKKEESQITNMECRECGAIIKTQLSECPYCDTPIRQSDREAVILEKGTTKEIKEYRIQTIPIHLRNKKVGHMNDQELNEYAEHMGYSKKWVWVQKDLRKRYAKNYENR